MTDQLTLFHAPQTRSTGALILLEELGVPYTLHALDLKAGEQRAPAFLAVNPMGKVPAVLHGEALVTEQVAIYIYLADRFPAAGLAPAFDDPLRGPYLRWMAFYGSCFEPALVDRALQREPGAQAMSPYGSFEAVHQAVLDQLAAGPYMLGERFSAVDLLWGTALGWVTAFGLMPANALIAAYVERIAARPAVLAVKAQDAAISEEHAARRPPPDNRA